MKKEKKNKKDEIDVLFLKAQKKLNLVNYSNLRIREFLLKKGANQEEINEVIEKLNRYSFINEDELVQNIITFCDKKHFGYNKIISMLISRKVSEERIKNVIKDEQRENKESLRMLNNLKKRYKNVDTVKLKQKIYSALIRYGFDENIAYLRASSIFNEYQIGEM